MKRAEKAVYVLIGYNVTPLSGLAIGNNVVGGVPVKKIKDIENDTEGLG